MPICSRRTLRREPACSSDQHRPPEYPRRQGSHMKARTITLLGAAALAAGALVLSGCSAITGSGEAAASGQDLPIDDEISTTVDATLTELLPAAIAEKGRLDIAVDIPFPPMAMY